MTSQSYVVRVYVLIYSFALIFMLLLGRLFWLQIVESSRYTQRSQLIVNQVEKIPTIRGQIMARDGEILATNEERFTLYWNPAKDGEYVADQLYQLNIELGKPNNHFENRLNSYDLDAPGEFLLIDNLKQEELYAIAEKNDFYRNITWKSHAIRKYNQASSFSHFLGYLGEINVSELEILYNSGYDANEKLGKSGLERQYDIYLRGKTGLEYNQVDARGTLVNDGAVQPTVIDEPVKGYNIKTSIDFDLQVLATKALGERVGSVVVLRPTTGEILAMVSYPTYDSNLFSALRDEDNKDALKELTSSESSPFLNRAFQSNYPPASTFKLVMTAMILEEHLVSPNFHINCPGYYIIGNRRLNCWKLDGHGEENLQKALADSCNVYFATIASEYATPDLIAKYAKQFGLGTYTGIDLTGEVNGNVPTREWKEKRFGSPWTTGDSANIGIGQGFSLTTPLQVANMVATIVNGGTTYQPHLLLEVEDPDTNIVVESNSPTIINISNISKDTFSELRSLMRYTVSRGSVAIVHRGRQVKYAGKTGTGQVGLENSWDSWFASYGPYDAPLSEQYVVVTMVEAVNEWEWWAPKAADIIYTALERGETYEEAVAYLQSRGAWYL